jgi:hypothetical protein
MISQKKQMILLDLNPTQDENRSFKIGVNNEPQTLARRIPQTVETLL